MNKFRKLLNWTLYNSIVIHCLRLILCKKEDRSFFKEFGFLPKPQNLPAVRERLAGIAQYMYSNRIMWHTHEKNPRYKKAFISDQGRYWQKYNTALKVGIEPSREDGRKWSWKDSLPREQREILNNLGL